MKCPICKSEGHVLYDLKADFIVENLESYYKDKCSNKLNIIDYTIFQCKQCSLQFSIPLQPGSNQFYEWVSSHSVYYPGTRWEWNIVIDGIKKAIDSSPINLLEIGCGTGKFLEKVQKVTQARTIGLDTTTSSIAKCKDKGLEVYCESIDSYIANSSKSVSFDFIVAFHCLEHLVNPKEFVMSLLAMIKPAGKIYLSTPYSPMSFEPVWFDPLNHPPHHITRWNEASYRELARQLNLNITLLMPDAASVIDRTLYTLNLSWNGPMNLSSNIGIKTTALMHPFTTLKEIIRQKNREKVNDKVAANVVLVELSRG